MSEVGRGIELKPKPVPSLEERKLLNEKLLMAAEKGLLRDVIEAIEKGADVNARDEDGHTPTHHAAGEGRLKVLKFLDKAGANLHTKTNKVRHNSTLQGKETRYT